MPTNSERLEAIKKRLSLHRQEAAKYSNHQWAEGGGLNYRAAPDDVDFLLDSLTRARQDAFDESAKLADDQAELLRKAIPKAKGERQDVILRLRMSTAKGIADAIRAARDKETG